MKALALCLICLAAEGRTVFDSLASVRSQRQVLKSMFDHAFDSYMTYAFPADMLHPISCSPGFRPLAPLYAPDFILGNYSLTLVDALDSLLLFGRYSDFQAYAWYLSAHLSFDRNIEVSVFETGIRVLGGLLGGYVGGQELHLDVVTYT